MVFLEYSVHASPIRDSPSSTPLVLLLQAYEVLGDEEKRSRYDQFGHAGVDPNSAGGNPFSGFQVREEDDQILKGGEMRFDFRGAFRERARERVLALC